MLSVLWVSYNLPKDTQVGAELPLDVNENMKEFVPRIGSESTLTLTKINKELLDPDQDKQGINILGFSFYINRVCFRICLLFIVY